VCSCIRQLLHLHHVYPWIGTSANLTITCLWKTIKMLIETKRMPIGKTLFIQVDGAADNINQTMLRFLAWLCQKGICKTVRRTSGPGRGQLQSHRWHSCVLISQVYLTRLPVGHTHEDVDQKFSVITRVGSPASATTHPRRLSNALLIHLSIHTAAPSNRRYYQPQGVLMGGGRCLP